MAPPAPQPTLYDSGRITAVEDHELKVGGTMGWHSLCENNNGGRFPRNAGSPADSVPPTGEVPLSGDSLTFEGTVTVKVSATARPNARNQGDEPVIQTITFKFPTQQVPMPTSGGEIANDGTGGTTRAGRINHAGRANFDGGHTIRSLVAVGNPGNQAYGLQGDMRLVAARRTVDDTYFKPAPNGAYEDSTRRNNQNHSLRPGWPWPTSGAAFGSLFNRPDGSPMTSYRDDGRPDIPAGIPAVFNSQGSPGDWDNGPAFISDGAL